MARLTTLQREQNRERADRASVIIDEYRHTHCEYEPDEAVLGDILADLMHAADQQTEMNFETALRMARINFEAEKNGED